MSAATASRSDVRAFFGALAFPLTAAVMLGVAAVAFGPRGPAVALMVNLFLLFEVSGFSQVLRLPMPEWYLRTWPLERVWMYEWLGIRAFKQLMRSQIYRRINPDFRLIGGRSGLAELRAAMDGAEVAHALAFMVAATLAAGAIFLRWFDAAGWLTFFNVLFNGYPVMLQRYNRMRLDPLQRAGRGSATLS